MSNRITDRDSLRIRTLAATGRYTPQEIASYFEERYTPEQVLRHLGTKDPENKKKLKRETSRGVVRLKSILSKIFPTVSVKEEFHVGHRLRVDLYIAEPYNICFEYDGVQHKKLTNHFHKDDEDFEKAKERDLHKEELCQGRGITLVRIAHDEELTEALVRSKIDEQGYGTGIIKPDYETNKEKLKRKRAEQNEVAKDRRKKRYQQYKKSESYEKNKQKQKELRKAQYQKQKEWKKQNKKR